MPKIDLASIPQTNASTYPEPFDREVAGRRYRRLAPGAGLTRFGASHVVLKPGAWSSQRHWHNGEDELLVMVAGEAVLVEDGGRSVIRPGDVVAWAAGTQNGHHLINESGADCTFVVVSGGDRAAGGGYSDIDLTFTAQGYAHRDGTPYPARRRP
ncbi:cupin domain-containing protein [Novosphingobium bradum]|uniref:Cupin domain-containing protein n=1 Tax=Novosphingobium bradum TaxID=1737444 RepID=A0ABV7INM5_9SPHN